MYKWKKYWFFVLAINDNNYAIQNPTPPTSEEEKTEKHQQDYISKFLKDGKIQPPDNSVSYKGLIGGSLITGLLLFLGKLIVDYFFKRKVALENKKIS
jgi:hypothetical protein